MTGSIVHVISGLGMGGAETMLMQLAGAMAQQGWRQHVVGVSDHDDFAGALENLGVDVTILGAKSYRHIPEAVLRLRRLLRAFKPGIIQGWMYHGDLFATLAHLCSPGRSHRTLLWNLRASNMDADRYARILRFNTLISSVPHAVIANSDAGAEFHLKMGYKPRKMAIIRNGVDIHKFRPDADARRDVRRQLGLPENVVVAIHVARVDRMKDHESFLMAMEKSPDLSGILVGKGTDNLRRLPNVRALGTRSDMSRIYAAADIVVSTSAFGEGFSNIIAEGMSCGLVPVTTDVGDARLIVGNSGYVVAPGDVPALTRVLKGLGSISKQERDLAGGAARERIKTIFSLDASVNAYLSLYKSLTLKLGVFGESPCEHI